MRELTYNEAAIEALAEEMRGDPKIFYMSSDADHRSGAGRDGYRRGGLRLPPDRRLAASDVLLCRDGPDRQSGREDPLHVRRPGDFSDPLSGGRRGRRAR